MDKYEVAQVLREMAFLIELTDENPKKSIAYRRAANSIEDLEDFDYLLKNNSLESISRIGKKISKMISLLLYENQLPYYTKLKISVPNSLFELMNIGLSVKKIRVLHEKIKISSINDLEKALEQKEITGIKGFSPYFLEKLKKRLKRYLNEGNFLLFPKANYIAEILKSKLSSVATKIEITGALRRKCEIINEISFIVATNVPENCRSLLDFLHNSIPCPCPCPCPCPK